MEYVMTQKQIDEFKRPLEEELLLRGVKVATKLQVGASDNYEQEQYSQQDGTEQG